MRHTTTSTQGRVLIALGTAALLAATGCSSSEPASSGSQLPAAAPSTSAPQGDSGATDTGNTWPGQLTGSSPIRFGKAYGYRAEIQMLCSGSSTTPTATLKSTDGWTAVTTAPTSGFGPSDVKVTSPDGTTFTFPANPKRGPIWNNGEISSIWGLSETVKGQEWQFFVQKGSCRA